jgi:soluble lytic murein transglycosylase
VEPTAGLDGELSRVTWRGTSKLWLCAAAGVASFGLSMTAEANSAAIDYFRSRADRTAVPALLTQEERT